MPEATPKRSRKRERRGGGFGRTLALGLVLVVAGAVAASVGGTFVTSLMRHLEHSRAVQPDGSFARVLNAIAGPPRDTGLVYRRADGQVQRLLVEQSEADRFVNETLLTFAAERSAAKAAASAELAAMFASAFGNGDEAINAYADWFYEWKRSYVLMKEATVSTVSHLLEVGEVEPLSTAVERDLKTYFLRHYSEQVLRPQVRDPIRQRVWRRRRGARMNAIWPVWRPAICACNFFWNAPDGLLSTRAQSSALTQVSLDWDAQRFQAPTYLMEDRAFDAVTGLGTVAVAGTIGAFALKTVIELAAARGLATFSHRAASAMAARLALAEAGAAAGALSPLGPVGGAVVGGVVGLAIDYGINEASEALGREAFVQANQTALAATVDSWQRIMEISLHEAIDVWYDDARDAIAVARISKSADS